MKKILSSNKKLRSKILKRIDLFINNKKHPLLKDHALKGTKNKFRSFSITGDMRIVYYEVKNEIVFTDIGTHNQVY